jgi:FkbM family methyltransferase
MPISQRLLSSVIREQGSLSSDDIYRLVGKDDPVIIEIGANVGQTTVAFIKRMPKAKIYCFEPDPRAAQHFREVFSALDANVTLFECAVGDATGTVVFHQSSGEGDLKDWNQSGSIREPKSHLQVWPWIKFQDQIDVPIVRLDDWALTHDITDVDFIWADVQGAEIDLINGAKHTLARTRFFYTEYSNDEWYEGQITLEHLYKSLNGFSVCRVFPMDALFENVTVGH